MGERNEILNHSITPEDSGLLYPLYSILVEIFKEADELLPDEVVYASGPSDNTKLVKNTQNMVEPIIVIFIRDYGIVKCKSACDRSKGYNLCEHSLSFTENEGLLNKFLQYLNNGSLRVSNLKGYQTLLTLPNQEILVKKQQNQHQSTKEQQIRMKNFPQNIVFCLICHHNTSKTSELTHPQMI